MRIQKMTDGTREVPFELESVLRQAQFVALAELLRVSAEPLRLLFAIRHLLFGCELDLCLEL